MTGPPTVTPRRSAKQRHYARAQKCDTNTSGDANERATRMSFGRHQAAAPQIRDHHPSWFLRRLPHHQRRPHLLQQPIPRAQLDPQRRRLLAHRGRPARARRRVSRSTSNTAAASRRCFPRTVLGTRCPRATHFRIVDAFRPVNRTASAVVIHTPWPGVVIGSAATPTTRRGCGR
jgi:hypothetical protein